MTQILDAALAYTRAGLSVIPANKDKQPALSTWARWQIERADEKQIRQWFRNGASVAIVGGAVSGGLIVLDFDEPQLFFKWKKATWKISKTLPLEKTGRGYHVFFKCPTPGGNEKIAPRIDKKAEGGCAVVAPSIHSSGARYEIIEGDLTRIPTISQADTDTLLQTAREIGGAAKNQNAYAEAALTNELEALSRAQEGGRNDQLNKAAFALGQFVGTGALERDEVEAQLTTTALAIWLGAEETRATIQSGLDAGMHEPRTIPEPTPFAVASNADEGATWLSLTDVLAAFHRGETGDAELFARLFADRVRYDHSERAWHLWRGESWQIDRTNQVTVFIANEVASQYLHAAAEKKRQAGEDAEKTVRQLYTRADALRYRTRIANVLTLAASQPMLALSGDEWDVNPMLLGVANGTLDLKSGELREANPRDYIRVASPIEWNTIDAPAPRWEQFLQDIFAGDSELIAFVQRLLGYGVTGLVSDHIFPVLWGEGRNGKDTLLETLAHVLGAFASPVQSDVLINTDRNPNAATPHLYALRGKRIVWVSETNEGARLNVGQVKLLTGGGAIVARPLYGKPVTFKPQYLLMLVTNHKPHANADDYALWQRLLLIPFTQAFVDKPQAANEHPRDAGLGEKLRGEASGILAWLVRGCLEWQSQKLNPPDTVCAATADYRQDEDMISKFIAERCIVQANTETKAGELYSAYAEWARSSGLTAMSATAFGKRMGKRFEKKTGHTNIYIGIGLTA